MKDFDKKDFAKDFANNEDIEYTIVLNGAYTGTLDELRTAVDEADKRKTPQKAVIDRLYEEYERMCLKEPTVLYKDDVYPHSYYWRLGDRYDPGKVEVLKEAIKQGKKIADTEIYQEYVEEVRNRKFQPDSWE